MFTFSASLPEWHAPKLIPIKFSACCSVVEWSLPTPEVRGSNPVIGKFLYMAFVYLLSTVLEGENKEKGAGNSPFKKLMPIAAIQLTATCNTKFNYNPTTNDKALTVCRNDQS